MSFVAYLRFVCLALCPFVFATQVYPSVNVEEQFLDQEDSDSLAYTLSLCAIFQNEACYLKEWLEFHKLVGVQHFYLFNNLSDDDYRRVLRPYISAGEVELIEWPYPTNPDGGNWSTIQCMAYNHALKLSSSQTKWLAILDTDEFLFPSEGDSLVALLSSYEGYAALGVNWQMYGTSFVQNIPSGVLMIEKLLFKAPKDYPENIHIKSIVQPARVESCWNPHFCNLKEGNVQVNPDTQVFTGPYAPYIAIDKVRINHYWSRDEEFLWREKIPRRNKWQEGTAGIFQRVNNCNQELDETILRFVPRLRQMMGF